MKQNLSIWLHRKKRRKKTISRPREKKKKDMQREPLLYLVELIYSYFPNSCVCSMATKCRIRNYSFRIMFRSVHFFLDSLYMGFRHQIINRFHRCLFALLIMCMLSSLQYLFQGRNRHWKSLQVRVACNNAILVTAVPIIFGNAPLVY